MKKLIALLVFSAALLSSAFATDVSLTNADAARLFVALRSAQPGLSASNTRNAALNINTLRPYVEAYEQGQAVVQRKASGLAKDPDHDAKFIALTDESQALSKQSIKVSLVPFSLSDDELKDAKVAPDSLAEFIRFLSPTPPALAKK